MKGTIIMENIELGAVQERFADLVWANEPIASGELVQLCEKELNWNKSTTYTVLRMLCQKGLLKNEKSLVTSRVSKQGLSARLHCRLHFPKEDDCGRSG